MGYQNILLIDDDDDDQEIFIAAVQELANSVVCTAINSAESALEKLESKQVLADLIFLDLNMPLMNGRQFLIKLKENEELEHIPVIVFSTSSNDRNIQETRDLGAVNFITKPSRFSDLKIILKSIIG
jgi:CheY-like chemotaxis protein